MADSKAPQDRKAPAAKAKKKTVTAASQWKKRSENMELELPSGNVALVRRPDPAELLGNDLLPDSITNKAQAAIDKAQGKPTDEDTNLKVDDVMSDPDAMMDMFASFDKITVMVVVEPVVLNHRDAEGRVIPLSKREQGDVIYTDDVDLEDKIFIFNWAVGGSSDLDSFRKQLEQDVADVSSGEGLELSPVDAAGDR